MSERGTGENWRSREENGWLIEFIGLGSLQFLSFYIIFVHSEHGQALRHRAKHNFRFVSMQKWNNTFWHNAVGYSQFEFFFFVPASKIPSSKNYSFIRIEVTTNPYALWHVLFISDAKKWQCVCVTGQHGHCSVRLHRISNHLRWVMCQLQSSISHKCVAYPIFFFFIMFYLLFFILELMLSLIILLTPMHLCFSDFFCQHRRLKLRCPNDETSINK